MNYKTIRLALMHLIADDTDDTGYQVIDDLDKYVENLQADYEAVQKHEVELCNKTSSYEKQVTELTKRIQVCEAQVARENYHPDNTIEYTPLGTIVLTEEEKNSLKWVDDGGKGYWTKISAIKLIRERTHTGLAEAKDAVEYWLTERYRLSYGKFCWISDDTGGTVAKMHD